ncbi:MAG TPA: hypothetical protein VKB51_15115 [bacterium]|nr:hypothetical protein [bacterium]
MKTRLAALLLVLLSFTFASASAQTIGAYFTLVNTYIYVKAPHEGRRILVRPRQAFNVVDVTTYGADSMWFQLVYPRDTAKTTGVGWTPTAPHELLVPQQEPVLVFSAIPDGQSSPQIFRVPAPSLELLNETQSNTPFVQVDWQKVRYSFAQPVRAWARGTAGIYRPGKTAAFMSRVYGELVTRNVSKEEQTRLLSGVIRVGDTTREVRWAMGDPLRSNEETISDARRTVWQYPELTVTFENEVVKQIN